MSSMVFYLGLWNPAGATRKKFETRDQREAYRATASRSGYIAWDAGIEEISTINPAPFDPQNPDVHSR